MPFRSQKLADFQSSSSNSLFEIVAKESLFNNAVKSVSNNGFSDSSMCEKSSDIRISPKSDFLTCFYLVIICFRIIFTLRKFAVLPNFGSNSLNEPDKELNDGTACVSSNEFPVVTNSNTSGRPLNFGISPKSNFLA